MLKPILNFLLFGLNTILLFSLLVSCKSESEIYQEFFRNSWLCHEENNSIKFRNIIKDVKNVNKLTRDNSTVLHAAVKSSCYDNTKLLLEYNADPNIKDANGNTPLHLAHKPNIIRLLMSHGAKSSIKNNENLSSLENSLSRCDYLSSRLFIEENNNFSINSTIRSKILNECSTFDKYELINLINNNSNKNNHKKYLTNIKSTFFYIKNFYYYSIASSYKVVKNKPYFLYDWHMARDNRKETCWKIDGDGKNEYIAFYIMPKVKNNSINEVILNITNGNSVQFQESNRVKNAIFEVYASQVRAAQDAFYIDDIPKKIKKYAIKVRDNNDAQKFSLKLVHNGKKLMKNEHQNINYIGKLTIKDIYSGSNNETCLSEINAEIK